MILSIRRSSAGLDQHLSPNQRLMNDTLVTAFKTHDRTLSRVQHVHIRAPDTSRRKTPPPKQNRDPEESPFKSLIREMQMKHDHLTHTEYDLSERECVSLLRFPRVHRVYCELRML